MNCNTTHYRANSSSVPGDPTLDPYQELNLRQQIETGKAVGPEIVATGPYLEGAGKTISWMHGMNGPEDARRMVRYWVEEGITWFKAYTQISRAELAAAIDEAHRHGMKVTAHLCSVGYREAVALGIDNLEHGLLTDTEFWPGKQPDVCPSPGDSALYDGLDIDGADVQHTIHDMVAHHVAMTSTLAVLELSTPSRIPLDPRVYEALAPAVATTVRAWYDSGASQKDGAERQALAKAMAFERSFVAAGGLLGAGSDPCCLTEIAGYGDQRDFELLVEAGFTPEVAIEIMPLNGARVLGMADRLGSVVPGKQATWWCSAGTQPGARRISAPCARSSAAVSDMTRRRSPRRSRGSWAFGSQRRELGDVCRRVAHDPCRSSHLHPCVGGESRVAATHAATHADADARRADPGGTQEVRERDDPREAFWLRAHDTKPHRPVQSALDLRNAHPLILRRLGVRERVPRCRRGFEERSRTTAPRRVYRGLRADERNLRGGYVPPFAPR